MKSGMLDKVSNRLWLVVVSGLLLEPLTPPPRPVPVRDGEGGLDINPLYFWRINFKIFAYIDGHLVFFPPVSSAVPPWRRSSGG
jgi:hypothetical protein